MKTAKIKEVVKSKFCTKCKIEHKIENFRVHKSGFVLNQCKDCEKAATKARRTSAIAKVVISEILKVTTKSGKTIEASTAPIAGGRKATSPNTDKVLYFAPGVNRDTARIAFSAFANVPTTGIQCPLV